jgi:Ca-activated chloride channel homolog
MSSAATCFKPVKENGSPVRLAMQRLWLTGQVLPAGARLVIQHVFRSAEERPLEVIYSFPLPRDAALRRFRITGDGFEAQSELRQTEEAVKEYEKGLADGSLSALVRQYGDGIVNLTVGNIRPAETVTVYLEVLSGVELRDDGFRFRFPFTLAPGYHENMRAAVTDGEGELELPADQFGDVILPRFRNDPSGLHEVGFELNILHEAPIQEIGSPSHSIRVKQQAGGPARASLGTGKDVPNRDLVLDVRFEEVKSQVLAGRDSSGKRSFAAIVPSTQFGHRTEGPRRTVILLDRSGSMEGEPIAQARKAIEACLGALSERDSFSLLAFDNVVEAMDNTLVPASIEQRERARKFLNRIEARGGTELAAGVREAARVLGAGGDIVIITDGQVLGTEAILAEARATGIRLSCLGIGSASQDRFLSLLARETGGISRFVTARERVDLAAIDLFASIGHPVAVGLKAETAQPELPAAVFAGTPVLVFGEVENDFARPVELRWDGGSMRLDVPSGDEQTGETVRLLRGSRMITDFESRYPSEEALATLEKRRQSRGAMRLLELSKTYGLASREMSLVAVVRRQGDRPGELPETRVVPVGMPQDTNFGSYFQPRRARNIAFSSAPPAPLLASGRPGALFAGSMPEAMCEVTSAAPPTKRGHDLVDLASMLEPDGGLPGGNSEVRAARTAAAILAFVAEGHTAGAGAFRGHVARLLGFLKSRQAASPREAQAVQKVLDAAAAGTPVVGDWLKLALRKDTKWKQLEAALRKAGIVS